MCRVLNASRSGYYQWCKGRTPQRQVRQRELLIKIKEIHEGSRRNYGSPRILSELRKAGIVVNHKTVEELMKRNGIQAMSSRMKADLVVDAFRMAIFRQKRQIPNIVHSDRGSQYASGDFRKELKKYGCKQSMSRKGDCWDNSVFESFFGTLKNELVHHEKYRAREEARLSIFDYIEMFYNRRRIHSYLNYVSPEEFEKSMETA